MLACVPLQPTQSSHCHQSRSQRAPVSPHLWCQVPSNPLWPPITQDPDPEQTQTRGKASKREREPPETLVPGGWLLVCFVTCLRSRLHTHPRRPELAFRASEPLGTHSLTPSPSSLGLGTGTWPFSSRFWLACRRFPPLLQARSTLPCERNIGSSPNLSVAQDWLGLLPDKALLAAVHLGTSVAPVRSIVCPTRAGTAVNQICCQRLID